MSPKQHILNDNESNSTPQTVFDSDEIKLHHTRVANKFELPRRVAAQTQRQVVTVPTPGNLREYLLAQSDSKDEVSESKQILFDKHIGGDQPLDQPKQGRFTNARQRFNHFRREQSDDCISSNYPNSSHSTIRDLTCSSVSSHLAASNSVITEDTESWKEPEIDLAILEKRPATAKVVHTDSFEYENRSERSNKRQMEDRWKSHTQEVDDAPAPPAAPTYDQSDPIYEFDELVKSMETPKYVRKAMTPSRESTAHYQQIVNRGVSMDMHKWPYNANDFQQNQKPRRSLFGGPPQSIARQTSMFQTQVPGYTREHLMRAQKFGTVIEAIRKPGHHVGPAKNPDCQCEHCRRWFAERENYRSRASSLGNVPLNRSTFWLTRRDAH